MSPLRHLIIDKAGAPKRILNTLEEVFSHYHELHDSSIILHRRNFFWGTNTLWTYPNLRGRNIYHLNASIEKDGSVPFFDKPVIEIKGYGSHEFEHFVEYKDMTIAQLAWFWLRYETDAAFKQRVEHRIELKAMKRGFADEVIAAVSGYFATLTPEQRSKVEQYYPNPEKLEHMRHHLDKKIEHAVDISLAL